MGWTSDDGQASVVDVDEQGTTLVEDLRLEQMGGELSDTTMRLLEKAANEIERLQSLLENIRGIAECGILPPHKERKG